jgi:glycosyltransferase involved in cell wall biosynthesis
MNQRITVLIPCKDEAHNISPCIESIGTLADEILIADSGSTDGTLQIARRLQKPDTSLRIIQREYVNPSDFKNWAIPQASNSWILTLDVVYVGVAMYAMVLMLFGEFFPFSSTSYLFFAFRSNKNTRR